MKAKVASWILYAVVAFAFGYAAVAKIIDPEHFLSSLLTYEVFPYKVAMVVALFAPWLELIAAFSLVTGIWRRGAVWLIAAMLVVFIALIAQAGMRGLSIDCGCYGKNELTDASQYALKIGEDVLLLIALWAAAWLGRRNCELRIAN